MLGESFRLGHYTCLRCLRSGVVVRQAEIAVVCCPTCGEEAVPTHSGQVEESRAQPTAS